MNFKYTLKKYYTKKIVLNFGKAHRTPNQDYYNYFIVIPAYAEYDYINHTLKSIDNQDKKLLSETLIIVIINNTESDNDTIKSNNKKTYDYLINTQYAFEMIVIDCFSRNYVLPNKKSGVGMARKIGHDYVLQYSKKNSLFFSLDADTVVHKNYLHNIVEQFKNKNFYAAVVNFSHQNNSNPKIQDAIDEYENLLKTIAYNIRNTGSPYGFVSMGSTIICTMESYIAVGGMPNKKATEDFYFLQRLAKFSKIYIIDDILVYPSSRSEVRVHLGTGFRMQSFKKGKLFNDLRINPQAYFELKYLFKTINDKWNCNIVEIISCIDKNNSKLYGYLKKNNFVDAFQNIQKNSMNKQQLLNQFHIWFDNFKIYQFLKLYV